MKRPDRMTALCLAGALTLLTGCGGSASTTPKTGEARAAATPSVVPLARAVAPAFPDVPADAWYARAVEFVNDRGIMTGTEKGFEPDSPFTRAQVATVFYRMAGEPVVTGEDAFTDTQPGQWYSDAVLWADQTGLVQGYGNGLFGAEDHVTQEQLVTILWRQAGEPVGTADASDVAPWYAGAIGWARTVGLTDSLGYPFDHAAEADRSQVAAILYRYLADREETVSAALTLTINGAPVEVAWEDNPSVKALKELAIQSPITVSMSPYGGFEQVGSLGQSLVRNDVQTTTAPGDIVLYSGNQMVIFHGSNSWAYTRLGHIQGKTQDELKALLGGAGVTAVLSVEKPAATTASAGPVVYFTSDISPEGLVAVYDALNWNPVGKVAVKVSTGEPPASNYLRPELIGDLVRQVDGTIVECNTAYGGSRASSAMHRQVAEDHGFTSIADFDLMDEEGEVSWPVTGGDRLDHILVGSHAENYPDWLILSHYKGHAMAGFGGAIKNVGIGASSASGKVLVHTAGTRTTGSISYSDQDAWLEALAEMVDGFVDHVGEEHIVYVNVMNRLSVDCDCNGRPAEPDIHDIGILASTDPVALDQACYDLVSAAEGNTSLMNRIQRQHGLHTLEHAQEIGLGSRSYTLVQVG